MASCWPTPACTPGAQAPDRHGVSGLWFVPAPDRGRQCRLWPDALARDARAAQVARMLALVGLDGLAQRYPHELSGGQQQRVLARALAPAAAPVAAGRAVFPIWMCRCASGWARKRDILKAAQATAILVTHDQHEAFAMADKVGVMEQGRIMQWDSPYTCTTSRPTAWWRILSARACCCLAKCAPTPASASSWARRAACARTALPPAAGWKCCCARMMWRTTTPAARARGGAGVSRRRVSVHPGAALRPDRAVAGPSHHDHAIGEEIGVRLDAEHLVAFAV